MSAKALIELRDVIRVWIEFRAPKNGELTWAVPASASPEEALEIRNRLRNGWSVERALTAPPVITGRPPKKGKKS